MSDQDFLAELGDIKDTTVPCATAATTRNGTVTPACTTATLGFVDKIQSVVASLYDGPRFQQAWP